MKRDCYRPIPPSRARYEEGTSRRFVKTVLLLTGMVFLYLKPAACKEQEISLGVSVVDSQGHPIGNLKPGDFDLIVNSKPKPILAAEFEANAPLSLGVLIDISRSMGGERVSIVLNWLKLLAQRLKSPDELFVNAFSDESQDLVDYISPEDYLEEPLDHLGAGGQSRMGLAVDLALIKLREARNRNRALILLSAGRDIAGPATLDHISKFGYPVYALGVGGDQGGASTIDRLKNWNVKGSALKVFADYSGGEAVFVESASDIERILDRLCYQMKNQYRIRFSDDSTEKPGKFAKVELKVKGPESIIRYAKRYPIPAQGKHSSR